MERISCIIPAYNEELTIKQVINSAKESDIFHEIIVVNDGSIDGTYEILRNEKGIIFVDLEHNVGKGGAVWHGLQHATGDIIVMLDADLVGIEKPHIEKLLMPIIEKQSDVCIGIIAHKKRWWMTFIQVTGSNLSGQQAFWKYLIEDANIKNSRFGVEIALKNHFKKKGAKSMKVFLPGVGHLMKEQKMGIEKGLKHRGKMYKEVGKEIGVGIKRKLKMKEKESI
ncbi:MAG TPA: glycosyltransferase family 2 protein [Patescibacteria group bacterium]|nr:glycosyltransferase family 2 protein [Patescibacteria group bacterium]